MSPLASLPRCRRKALFALCLGLALVAAARAAQANAWLANETWLGMLTGLGVGSVFVSVLMWFTPDAADAVPKGLMRRYYRDLMPAMAAYVAVMLVWKKLLGWVEWPALRVLVALLPAVLVVWIMRAFVRYVRDSDEMQRRIEMESGTIATLVVSAGYMAAGFLQTAGLIDVPSKVAMLWVFPMLCFSYGIARIFVARRYL